MIVTFKDFKDALKKIEDNPKSHGLSEEDYEKVIVWQAEMRQTTQKLSESFRKVNEHFSQVIKSFQVSAAQLEARLEAIRFVASHDWLVSFNIFSDTTLQEMFAIITKKDKETFERFVLKEFPKSQKFIFKKILDKVPHRQQIITEIEQCYKRKLYSSVVTLCYTQVDGICNEKLNYGFFDTDNKTHDLKIQSLELKPNLSTKIASQLKEPKNELSRYVRKDIQDRTFELDSFNRHLVLHGHSISYGTKKNAIRAILLLDFVCALLIEEYLVSQ